MGEHKTIIFGLDGACWDLIEEWFDDGHLPTLSSLVERGGRAELESCVPATTPPAWTSMTTGVNPGKHGVFGFYSRQRETYDVRPVSDRDVHARRLWDYTSEAELTSLVINVPVTHPARRLDGVLVPGYLAPDTPTTYPESILEATGHSEYRVYAPSEAEDVPDARLREEWLDLTRSRADLALSLLDDHEWDLLFLEFQKTDGAVHKFDEDADIRAIYECVDDCMGRILTAVEDPVNVVVVSDHGIGQEKEWAISLNTWLHDQGYLETTTTDGIEKQEWLSAATGDRTDPDRGSTGGNVFASVGLTRQRIERLLSGLGMYDIARRIVPDRLKDAVGEATVDRERSIAFYEGIGFSGVDTGLVINSQEFYESGVVTPTEYDSIREKIVTELEELTGPAGPVFSSVRPREDIYSGERTPYAPDIVLEQADPYVIGSTTPRGKTFIRTEENRIDHRRHGLFVAAGPDVSSDWTLQSTPSIVDVVPTLLHLLDCPLSASFDGDVLSPVLATDREPRFETYGPYEPGDAYALSSAERESLEDRLTQMGYLE